MSEYMVFIFLPESEGRFREVTMARPSFQSVDDYIAAQPPPARPVLQRVRATIRKALPRATEGISYQIPVYKIDGAMVLYFAGFPAPLLDLSGDRAPRRRAEEGARRVPAQQGDHPLSLRRRRPGPADHPDREAARRRGRRAREAREAARQKR